MRCAHASASWHGWWNDSTSIGTHGDEMPFATTKSSDGPWSMLDGTAKFVETVADPVATPIVECPNVRQ